MTAADLRARLHRQVAAAGRAPELDLVLAAARGAQDADAMARIHRRVAEPLDWRYVAETASRHGMIPLVYRALRDVPGVPQDARALMRAPAHSLALLSALRSREVRAVMTAVRDAGVPALTFKGVALGVMSYGSESLRKPGDLDLLIHARDYEAVRDLLEPRGYAPRTARADEAHVRRTRSSITFEHPDGDVDLHWTLDQKPFDSLPYGIRFDDDALWAESVTVDLGGTPVRTLGPAHALLYLCGHGVKHSWALFYSACDVAETVRAHPGLDWDAVAREARSQRMTRIYHLGLLLGYGLLGAPVPADVLATALADARACDAACAVAGWVFDPDSKAGERHLDLPDKLKYYRYRMALLERPHEKGLYLLFRGLRRFWPSKPAAPAPGGDGAAPAPLPPVGPKR